MSLDWLNSITPSLYAKFSKTSPSAIPASAIHVLARLPFSCDLCYYNIQRQLICRRSLYNMLLSVKQLSGEIMVIFVQFVCYWRGTHRLNPDQYNGLSPDRMCSPIVSSLHISTFMQCPKISVIIFRRYFRTCPSSWKPTFYYIRF